MDHISNSRGGQFGFESFERNRKVQIKNLTIAINEVLKEISKEIEDDCSNKDIEEEDSNNQTSSLNNTSSKETSQINDSSITSKNKIKTNACTLEFPSTSNECISNDGVSTEQASIKIADSILILNGLHSENMLQVTKQTENKPVGEKFEERQIKAKEDCKELDPSDDEYFTQPQAPNTFKGVFLNVELDINNTTKDKCGLAYKIIKFFIPPKMPAELLSFLSHPRLSGCAQTEKTLYYAQVDLYLGTHPLIEALFGISKASFDKLGKVQSLMTEGLQSILSSFLNISQARRENVRPLIMNEAADVLKNVSPTTESLFGCDDIDLRKLKKIRLKKKAKTMKRKY